MDLRIYPDEYFEDEIRDGYLVPGMMKRLWAKNLKCYKTLEKLCDDHGVSCFATWGSMVGAVRHGGYVPWDDDIDVMMIRNQYAVIEKLDREGKLPGDYWIRDYTFTGRENLVRCFLSTRSLVEKYEDWGDGYGFPFAGLIDIFLMDYLPMEEDEAKRYWDILDHAGDIKEREKTRDRKRIDPSFERELKKLSGELDYPFQKGGKESLLVQILRAMDEFCERYDENNCDHLSIPSYFKRNPAFFFEKRMFSHFVDMRFEETTVRIPAGYDGMLRFSFGDYMIPVLQADNHGYPMYETMNEDARSASGFELKGYRYEAEEINRIRSSRTEKESLKERLMKALDILRDIHGYLCGISGAPDAVGEVSEFCGQCQELAIRMGEMIEQDGLNGASAVQRLEEYCEFVYRIHTGEEEERIRLCQELSDYENSLYIRFCEVREKKRIVFLTFRAKEWEGLHALWEQAIADDEWEVTVIRVPYYYKDFYQQIDKKKMILEEEGYPEEIVFTPYDGYDFEALHPDVIIHTFPYDEYNSAISFHPYYYMSNLYKLTDRLVLIPAFCHREVSQGNRVRYVLKTFFETPGVVIADTVFLQSEEMREACGDFYHEITGEETKDAVKRVYGVGIPLDDRCPGPAPERPTVAGDRKILLYMPGGSVIYEHGEEALKEAEIFLEGMKAYEQEILVMWCEDPYIRAILEPEPELWAGYRELKEKYADDVLYIEADSELDRSGVCDGMYGAGCVWMNECRKLNKPVLWETPGVKPSFELSGEGLSETEEDGWIGIEGRTGRPMNTVGDLLSALSETSKKETNPDENVSGRIWHILKNPKRRVAVVYTAEDAETGEKLVDAFRGQDTYEVLDCALGSEDAIRDSYLGWGDVDLVMTVNLAGFTWRSSGDNSMYATLPFNTLHYIDRDIADEERRLSGLLPITMRFLADTEKRMTEMKNRYPRIYDIRFIESVEEELGDILDTMDWRY